MTGCPAAICAPISMSSSFLSIIDLGFQQIEHQAIRTGGYRHLNGAELAIAGQAVLSIQHSSIALSVPAVCQQMGHAGLTQERTCLLDMSVAKHHAQILGKIAVA